MSSPEPRVSVIIPCFNQARYLGEAIESVLAQNEARIEVLVVDDGSRDGTRSVAEAFPAVRYLHQRNRGTAAARNHGFRSSRGEFVLFLDADDRLMPGAIESAARYLDAHARFGFAYGFVQVIHPDGSLLRRPPQEAVEQDHYRNLLRHNFIWTPGAVLYRRGAIVSVGGFRSMAGGCADLDLNLRIARSYPLGCHGETVLEYRDHASSQSANSAEMLRSALRVRRAQRRAVRGRPDLVAAWSDGIREDRAYYGSRLAASIAAELEARRWTKVISGLFTLVCYDPRRFLNHVARRVA